MTFASSKCFTYLTICCSLMHKDVIWSSSSLLFSYPMKNLYPFHKDTFQILLSYWYPHCLPWLDFWKNGTYCNQFRQYRISKIAWPSFKYTGVKILFNWREDSRGYFYMRSIFCLGVNILPTKVIILGGSRSLHFPLIDITV